MRLRVGLFGREETNARHAARALPAVAAGGGTVIISVVFKQE
jgi:hypothetical protein